MSVDHPGTQRVLVQGEPVDEYPDEMPAEIRGAAVLRITETGEDILGRTCKPVTDFGTAELSKLVNDMFLTMYVAEGCGLAANQVDVDLALFVYDCFDDDGVRHVGHVLNPVMDELDPADRFLDEAEEGCLSVPGPSSPLARPDKAVVRGVDQHGTPVVIEGTGYFARCLQHETDHLNGRLYIDLLNGRARKTVLREMEEMRPEIHARRAERTASL